MKLDYNTPTAKEYIELRVASNMGGGAKKVQNSEVALNNSLFIVAVRDNGKLIGLSVVVAV